MPEAVEISPSDKAAAFLDRLREETAEKHKALESTKLSLSLLSSDATIDDYRRYLAAMQEIVAFTESKIFPLISEVVNDLEFRRKLPALTEDLSALQSAETGPGFSTFDPALEHPSLGYGLGFMYVIEGSVLGGRVILKQLQKNHDIRASAPHRYFAAYGEQTGKMWKDFLTMITSPASLAGNEQEMIKGANHAFSSIKTYFEKVAQ